MWDSDIDEIKKLPIVEVAKRVGIKALRGNKAMCFGGHDKRTPSLIFSNNLWHCFGCGQGGSVIDLVMRTQGFDIKTAIRWLADEFGVTVHRHRRSIGRSGKRLRAKRQKPDLVLVRATPDAGDLCFAPDPEVYSWLVSRCGPVTRPDGVEYLRRHAISSDIATRFGVRELCEPERAFRGLITHWGPDRVFRSGLAFGNGGPQRLIWSTYTLLLPFYRGEVVEYLQGRQFAGGPKFLNLQKISKPIFNLDGIHDLAPNSVLHICEGIPDALSLESLGHTAVAVLGASQFRSEWVELFLPFDVVLMPDGDGGGDTFRRTISKRFADRAKYVRVVEPVPRKDVADVAAAMRGPVDVVSRGDQIDTVHR